MNVTLISHTPDPIRALYLAYRVCYSRLSPEEILGQVESGKISRERMAKFVAERLQTGHASPLEQVVFEFLISGVSRAMTHQFVRHRIGISFEQQSQRYVTYENGEFPYVVPPTIARDPAAEETFNELMGAISVAYDDLIKRGIPAEDARFVLPNATASNLKVAVNLQELLHIGDLRLCTRAQWEFRRVVALMRSEVLKAVPELGRMIQPKCGERRMGYCDEEFKDWEACPLGRVRPHKSMLPGKPQPLAEEHWVVIEESL